MLIKVSGIRDLEQISTLAKMNVDYLAFDFMGSSERFFAQNSGSVFIEIPRKIKRVGAFDAKSELYIISLAGALGLSSVEMDGRQSPQFCEKIAAEGLEIIKVFYPDEIERMSEFEGVCNKFVLKGFGIEQLSRVRTKTPFFVEGNMALFYEILANKDRFSALSGFDTGCGFETAVGVKSIDAVEKLILFKTL